MDTLQAMKDGSLRPDRLRQEVGVLAVESSSIAAMILRKQQKTQHALLELNWNNQHTNLKAKLDFVGLGLS